MIASTIVDAADYGCPSKRVRLIAATPRIIRYLEEQVVIRVSIADAFDASELKLPAQFLRSNTTKRNGKPCVRSVQDHAFTVTASHPLTWCSRDGKTVRCLNVKESAILMGFPETWLLPNGSRAGIRAVGNAVPPPLAKAIMVAAVAAAVYLEPKS